MTHRAGAKAPPDGVDRLEIEEALGRALAYLRGAQLPHGQFRSYHCFDAAMAGECYWDPTLFVPTSILYSLSFAGLDGGDPMVRKGLDWLLAERDRPGVWRYHPPTQRVSFRMPPDVDDTCLIGFVLEMYGLDPRVDRELLLAKRDWEGLF